MDTENGLVSGWQGENGRNGKEWQEFRNFFKFKGSTLFFGKLSEKLPFFAILSLWLAEGCGVQNVSNWIHL